MSCSLSKVGNPKALLANGIRIS